MMKQQGIFRVGLAAFVKTPHVSPLKTRLAATIGEEKAIEFFTLSVKAIERTLLEAKGKLNERFFPHWAVAEEKAVTHNLWAGMHPIFTGYGDLGERQEQVFNHLLQHYDGAILIGADTPQITTDHIIKAIEALSNCTYVFGPAHDGGYYLFGGKEKVASSTWKNVPWSSPDTRQIFCDLLPSTPIFLDALSDVDIEDDLEIILNEMPQNPNQGQLDLMEWIVKHL